jgi:hypothetical protein
MRAYEILTELRQSLDQYLKQQFSNWPDYVVRDFIYKNAKGMNSQDELQDWIAGIKKDYPVKQWRLETLTITLDVFDTKTQQQIKTRAGGSVNPYGVPKDAERHATQQSMIQKQGVSKEPIIVFKKTDGLELMEGWHRTIQHLQAYPQGYQGPAWVGYL